MAILSIPFSTQQAESGGVKCPALNENMYIIKMNSDKITSISGAYTQYYENDMNGAFEYLADLWGNDFIFPNSKLNFGYLNLYYEANHSATMAHDSYVFNQDLKNALFNRFFNTITYNNYFSSDVYTYWTPLTWNDKTYNGGTEVTLKMAGNKYPIDENGDYVEQASMEYFTGISFNKQDVFFVDVYAGYPIKEYRLPSLSSNPVLIPYYACPTFRCQLRFLVLPNSSFDGDNKIISIDNVYLGTISVEVQQTGNFLDSRLPDGLLPYSVKVVSALVKNNNYNYSPLLNVKPKEAVTNPFNDKDGDSGTGGGKGDGDNNSDLHPIPSPPAVSISDTGYFTIYNPTQQQMKSLSAKLWDGDFDLSNIKSLMSSPIENILSLAYVPLPVSGATAVTAKIGGADMGVTVNKLDKHFFQLDLGTVAIKEFYGSYLDYYPHTVVYIFLPYIGIISLDTNEVMGKTLRLVYNYDVVTGSVIAYISTNGLNSKLYEYNGNCIYNLPVTGRDFSTIISGALGLASSAVGAVVTHGASIPFSVGTVGQSLIDTQLPNYKHSGDVGGSPAIMDDRQPCVIIIRPRKINSKHQPKYTGYGSLITKKLSNVSGFTMVNDIRLNGISGATDIEIEEIRRMLKEGVVF